MHSPFRRLRRLPILLVSLALAGCASTTGPTSALGYYWQSVRGHLQLMHAAEPIDRWIARTDILDHQWVDNGPGWAALRLQNAARVLSLQPDWAALAPLKLGVVGAHQADDAAGHDAQFEVRSFIGGGNFEDPVTGSLNAGLAQWLIGAGIAPPV